MKKNLYVGGLILAIALGVSAQTKKGSVPILQPQMTVETGSYEKPAGKLGQKPAAPWTSTTVGASVDGKPNAGAKEATLTGEIVDFSCYLQIGKHGEKHRACAQKCFTAGQPIGLMTKDGNLYMLMEEEHDPRRDGLTNFRAAAIEHASHIMEVTGTLSEHGGYKALYVHGFLKK
ncbi:MAG TPA: hypothetical protein VER03_08540 [Bryobacteraceae bacterium]|nr:hypothetical protein [Bryobacteraceae bacterium]